MDHILLLSVVLLQAGSLTVLLRVLKAVSKEYSRVSTAQQTAAAALAHTNIARVLQRVGPRWEATGQCVRVGSPAAKAVLNHPDRALKLPDGKVQEN